MALGSFFCLGWWSLDWGRYLLFGPLLLLGHLFVSIGDDHVWIGRWGSLAHVDQANPPCRLSSKRASPKRYKTPFAPGLGTGYLGIEGLYCLHILFPLFVIYFLHYQYFQSFCQCYFQILGLKSHFDFQILDNWMKLWVWFFLHLVKGLEDFLEVPQRSERGASLPPTTQLQVTSRTAARRIVKGGFFTFNFWKLCWQCIFI